MKRELPTIEEIDFLNELLNRANIKVNIYITEYKKLIRCCNIESKKVLYNTDKETLFFILVKCDLQSHIKNLYEEEWLYHIFNEYIENNSDITNDVDMCEYLDSHFYLNS